MNSCLIIPLLLGNSYQSNGQINRAAPELLGSVELSVGAAPIEQVFGKGYIGCAASSANPDRNTCLVLTFAHPPGRKGGESLTA